MFAPKNVWGTPTRFVVKASKPSSNSSVYKNYRGQEASTPYGPKYSLLKKSIWVVPNSHVVTATLWIVNQSSPDFFRRTRDESFSITYLSDF